MARRLEPCVYIVLSVNCPKCHQLMKTQPAWRTITEISRYAPMCRVWLEHAPPRLVSALVDAAASWFRPVPDPELGVPLLRVGTPFAVVVSPSGEYVVVYPSGGEGWELTFAREVADFARLFYSRGGGRGRGRRGDLP